MFHGAERFEMLRLGRDARAVLLRSAGETPVGVRNRNDRWGGEVSPGRVAKLWGAESGHQE